MTTADPKPLLELFQRIVPKGQWQELDNRQRPAQIYTLPVLVGLMLAQRLSERGTQQEALHQLYAGRLNGLLPQGKRVREGKVSLATGGYARASGKIDNQVVEQVCDEMLAELGRVVKAQWVTAESAVGVAGEKKRRVMLLDGSSLRVEHVKGLLEAFPPGHNQHGEGHWGVVKWVALHDVDTGIAERPAWGPMYGAQAVSEQALAEQVLERAPADSVILGDGNFGIFCFAYAVAQSQRDMIFRLIKSRAESLGARQLRPGEEMTVVWEPSAYERKQHPDLPPEAKVQGRLMVAPQNGFRQPLYLFTTLTQSVEQIVAWYGKRWNVELDLRTLKGTLRMEQLHGKSRKAVEKELLIAVVAYGLVRAFMAVAAWEAGLPPRGLSFTRVYGLLNAACGQLCCADQTEADKAYARLMAYIGKAKLPNRTKARKYPREVWGSGKHYPRKHPQNPEAK